MGWGNSLREKKGEIDMKGKETKRREEERRGENCREEKCREEDRKGMEKRRDKK